MGAISKTEDNISENIQDDISNVEVKSDTIDPAKLASLRAKNQAKQQESKMANKIIGKKEKSLKLGVIGAGQCGSKLASIMYNNFGYDTIVMNTAQQDLKFIAIPDSNKLLFTNHSVIGGAARELSIGEAAAEAHRGEVLQMVNDKLDDVQVHVLCTSLGGGSGAGSTPVLVDILTSTGKPLVVIAVLPMDSEDVKVKSNALETLSKLSELVRNKTISNLIVADNSKIEAIYHNVSQVDFYDVANKAIVDVLDVFNTLSCSPSPMKPLDSAEFTKLLLDGNGLTVYGELTVKDFVEETAIAEAVMNNLSGNLLADSFNLKEAKYVGFMVAANKSVWDQIPSSSINYAAAMIGDLCGSPQIFKGLYVVDMPENVVKVYSYFTGLGLPASRTEQLKKDVVELQTKSKDKDEARNLTLKLDTGVNETVSQAQKVKERIASKNSAFGKLMGGNTDRRK